MAILDEIKAKCSLELRESKNADGIDYGEYKWLTTSM